MGKLTKILSVVCSASLIFSVPSVSLANLEKRMENVHKNIAKYGEKLDKQIDEIKKDVELKKEKLNLVEKEIDNLKKEIDNLLKQSEKEKVNEDIVLKINSKKSDLAKEKDHCNECRDVLDSLTAVLLSDEQNQKDQELILSKSVAQENFYKSSKQVQELEKELENLEISKYECKDLKIELEKLTEKKLQSEQERNKLKEEIEQCNKTHDKIFTERAGLEERANREINLLKRMDAHNKKLYKVWTIMSSGNQNENNVLDGQKIEKTCGIFAATNIINHFECSFKRDGMPIRGFNDVIKFYLSHGGKKENLNKVLSYEELKEFLQANIVTRFPTCVIFDVDENEMNTMKFIDVIRDRNMKVEVRKKINKISTYYLGYEERTSNISDLNEEMQKQMKNVKDFLVAHFKANRLSKYNVAPVLNLNNGHWQTFATYDEMDKRILLVDSSLDNPEWVDLDVIAKNIVSVQEDKLNWGLLFAGSQGFNSDSDYFGVDLENPLTDDKKERVINKLCNNLI